MECRHQWFAIVLKAVAPSGPGHAIRHQLPVISTCTPQQIQQVIPAKSTGFATMQPNFSKQTAAEISVWEKPTLHQRISPLDSRIILVWAYRAWEPPPNKAPISPPPRFWPATQVVLTLWPSPSVPADFPRCMPGKTRH